MNVLHLLFPLFVVLAANQSLAEFHVVRKFLEAMFSSADVEAVQQVFANAFAGA